MEYAVWLRTDPSTMQISTVSPVFTAAEAAKYLRLTDEYGSDVGRAIEALYRIVRKGELHPILGLGRTRKFAIAELERYVRVMSEAAGEDEEPGA